MRIEIVLTSVGFRRKYVPSLLLVDRVPRTKSKKTDRRKLHMLKESYYMEHRGS